MSTDSNVSGTRSKSPVIVEISDREELELSAIYEMDAESTFESTTEEYLRPPPVKDNTPPPKHDHVYTTEEVSDDIIYIDNGEEHDLVVEWDEPEMDRSRYRSDPDKNNEETSRYNMGSDAQDAYSINDFPYTDPTGEGCKVERLKIENEDGEEKYDLYEEFETVSLDDMEVSDRSRNKDGPDPALL